MRLGWVSQDLGGAHAQRVRQKEEETCGERWVSVWSTEEALPQGLLQIDSEAGRDPADVVTVEVRLLTALMPGVAPWWNKGKSEHMICHIQDLAGQA